MREEANAPVPSSEAVVLGWARQPLIARFGGLFRGPALAAATAVVLLAMICGYQFGRIATAQFNRFVQPRQASADDWMELVPREFASAKLGRKVRVASQDTVRLLGAGGRK